MFRVLDLINDDEKYTEEEQAFLKYMWKSIKKEIADEVVPCMYIENLGGFFIKYGKFYRKVLSIIDELRTIKRETPDKYPNQEKVELLHKFLIKRHDVKKYYFEKHKGFPPGKYSIPDLPSEYKDFVFGKASFNKPYKNVRVQEEEC
jgi:hypothetical protein